MQGGRLPKKENHEGEEEGGEGGRKNGKRVGGGFVMTRGTQGERERGGEGEGKREEQ